MLGLGHALWQSALDAQRPLPAGDADRYMFFATRNRMPSGGLVVAAAPTSYVATRICFAGPQYNTNHFRFHFSGFALTEGGNSPQESVLPGNGVVIDKAFMRVGSTDFPLDFAGAPAATIASGAVGLWGTVILPADLPADAAFAIVTYYHTAAGENQIPVYRIQKHRDEKVWGAASLAALEALVAVDATSTAALDINYNLVTQPQYYGPDFMVARGWTGAPVVVGTVDSIGEARQEYAVSADERGNMGWVRRWLDTLDPTHGRIAHCLVGVPGAAALRELTTGALKRWTIIDEVTTLNGGKPPFTVLLNQLGQNDTTSPYATYWSRMKGFLARFRARYPGVRVICAPPLGRTTSTDRWLTTANQTFSTDNTYPTGGKWLLRDDLLANRDGLHDGCIDTFSAWSDAAAAGKWDAGFNHLLATTTATAGDGATPWTQFQTDAPLLLGQQVTMESSTPGTYTGGTVINVEGEGPYTITRLESAAAQLPAGKPIYAQTTSDGVHPNLGAILRLVANLPQSEKARLYG